MTTAPDAAGHQPPPRRRTPAALSSHKPPISDTIAPQSPLTAAPQHHHPARTSDNDRHTQHSTIQTEPASRYSLK